MFMGDVSNEEYQTHAATDTKANNAKISELITSMFVGGSQAAPSLGAFSQEPKSAIGRWDRGTFFNLE